MNLGGRHVFLRVGLLTLHFFLRASAGNAHPALAAVQPSIPPIPCKLLYNLIPRAFLPPLFVATQPRRSLDSFSGLTTTPLRPSPNFFICHTSETRALGRSAVRTFRCSFCIPDASTSHADCGANLG